MESLRFPRGTWSSACGRQCQPLAQVPAAQGMQREVETGGLPQSAQEGWESQQWAGVCQVRKQVKVAPKGGSNLDKGIGAVLV